MMSFSPAKQNREYLANVVPKIKKGPLQIVAWNRLATTTTSISVG